jgi:hypothetical protein
VLARKTSMAAQLDLHAAWWAASTFATVPDTWQAPRSSSPNLCSPGRPRRDKGFDLGAFTVAGGVVLVSDQANGSSGFHETLMAFHGGPVREPQRPDWGPEPGHLAWHRREAFKGDPRHRG